MNRTCAPTSGATRKPRWCYQQAGLPLPTRATCNLSIVEARIVRTPMNETHKGGVLVERAWAAHPIDSGKVAQRPCSGTEKTRSVAVDIHEGA